MEFSCEDGKKMECYTTDGEGHEATEPRRWEVNIRERSRKFGEGKKGYVRKAKRKG